MIAMCIRIQFIYNSINKTILGLLDVILNIFNLSFSARDWVLGTCKCKEKAPSQLLAFTFFVRYPFFFFPKQNLVKLSKLCINSLQISGYRCMILLPQLLKKLKLVTGATTSTIMKFLSDSWSHKKQQVEVISRKFWCLFSDKHNGLGKVVQD